MVQTVFENIVRFIHNRSLKVEWFGVFLAGKPFLECGYYWARVEEILSCSQIFCEYIVLTAKIFKIHACFLARL
jgi:hypothetical protein